MKGPAVIHEMGEAASRVNDVDRQLYLYTEDGLRSIVEYNIPDGYTRYEVFIGGDFEYGLVGFWLYQYLRIGKAPEIDTLGRRSEAPVS